MHTCYNGNTRRGEERRDGRVERGERREKEKVRAVDISGDGTGKHSAECAEGRRRYGRVWRGERRQRRRRSQGSLCRCVRRQSKTANQGHIYSMSVAALVLATL